MYTDIHAVRICDKKKICYALRFRQSKRLQCQKRHRSKKAFIKFMLEMKRQWPLMIIGNGMNYQWWSGWIPTRPGFNGPVNFNSKTNTKACSSCWLSARNRLPGKDLNYDCSKSVPPSDQTRDWIACLLLFCCGGWKVIRHGLE